MDRISELWNKTLDILQKEVTAVSFDLWIKSLEPFEFKDGVILLSTTSATAKNQVLKLHSKQIKDALQEVSGDIRDFKVYDIDERDALEKEERAREEYLLNNSGDAPSTTELCKFNPNYTFEKFVVGNSNKFVYAAAHGVADNLGKINPLFIYGGPGLGKTHLLHAIGNHIRKNSPELKVFYTTCENFTNDYAKSLMAGNTNTTFREKYRNLDVLMIDDIQFISNKTGTQEEFFNTFNDLYKNGKQIVVASDRPPREINHLEERIIQRLSMGLIQDVQSPDFETRLAILQKKAEQEKVSIDPEVISYIAESCDTNIREMEGMLTKVCFYAPLLGKTTVGMDEVREALKDHVTSTKPSITGDSIIDCTCKYFGIKREDLVGKKKNKEIVEPRQVCMYIITELLDLPLTSIGQLFGGRDHTTVIHAREKVNNDLASNPRLKVMVDDIKNMCQHR